MNNRVVIFLGHPAHFHLLKNAANELIKKGYDVTFLIKRKDILEDLVSKSGYHYVVVRNQIRKQSGIIELALSLVFMDLRIFHYLFWHRPKVLIGTYCPVLSWLTGVPCISVNEDDANVVPRFASMSYPFSQSILVPTCCDCGKWNEKAINYPSYHELAYLHPNHFAPNKDVVEKYGIDTGKPYFILRFASLKAHHDAGIQGINTEIAQHLIDQLKLHGTIYITSERPLEPQFEQYRIKINPLDMHHVMAFASLYIGDSQTMAAEAGVLGTPFVRFNDFVGRIGYLRELEDVYHLGYGIHATPIEMKRADGSLQPNGTEALYAVVDKILALSAEERYKIYQTRREQMLSEKIDYAKFLTWFIENYPSSAKEAKNANEDFWKKFK